MVRVRAGDELVEGCARSNCAGQMSMRKVSSFVAITIPPHGLEEQPGEAGCGCERDADSHRQQSLPTVSFCYPFPLVVALNDSP